MPNTLIGLSRDYKAVSIGNTLANTTASVHIFQANALKPYAPVHISGQRDIAGDITIRWVRRTRVAGEWRDAVEVPLGEASERYEIDIMDNGNVARTLIGITTPEVSYSVAEQIADFGTAQSTISIKLYQISEIAGRGTPAIATL